MNTVPNKPKTTIRGIRVPDDLWEAAQAKAAGQERPVSEVVRRYLESYVMTDEEVEASVRTWLRTGADDSPVEHKEILARLISEYESAGLAEARPDLWAALLESLEAIE